MDGEVFIFDFDSVVGNFGAMGKEVVDLIFQLTGKEEGIKREWKHLIIPKYLFWQYTSMNGKTWDKGVFNKKLCQIVTGKKKANKAKIVSTKHVFTLMINGKP